MTRSSGMNLEQARAVTGGLSRPSKMPGFAYSIPAQHCKTGAKLAKKEGSVCHGCYALKGRYNMAVVKQALQRRMDAITGPDWVEGMTTLISSKKSEWFRWHDSGDLQSLEHLEKICEVCEQTPDVNHWLPTREVSIVQRYLDEHEEFPSNLVVRVSSPMIDGPPLPYPHTSTVVSDDSYTCPAPHQGNECKDCRKCWDTEVANVSYHKH